MNKEIINLFHKELTTLENDKEENKISGIKEEQQLLGFCLRIIKLLNISEIKNSIGISNAMLKNIQKTLK